MLKIKRLTICGKEKVTYLDEIPYFGFALESDKDDNALEKAYLTINEKTIETKEQIHIAYDGELKPFTPYEVKIKAIDKYEEEAEINKTFCTGKLNQKWLGAWISDPFYQFKEAGSPKVMTFVKHLRIEKLPKRALICLTTLGIYRLYINGRPVSEDYFTPGFTTYKDQLQYQIYDITPLLTGNDDIKVVVAGGWAVGDFTYGHKNRITANRQALKAEIHLFDEEETIIPSDTSWKVTTSGPYQYADFYDGEIYDANEKEYDWHQAAIEKVKTEPKQLIAHYGEFVREHEIFKPISVKQAPSGEYIYDFGQNFAGIVKFNIKNAQKGQKIIIHHAEVLYKDELCLRLLRKAKATITYICREGAQSYAPTFTYMGFRYIGVSGINPDDIEITAQALYSDVDETGAFSCSDERLNKLQENIRWSAKSNFVEIPTDCPQRDERMGWTGDIGLFANTALYNFEMDAFLRKWLKDLRSEQIRSGGFPNTVPSQSHGFPLTMPNMAIDFWGDCCIFVPYALYLHSGDKTVLEENYQMMQKYHHACLWWAHLLSVGKSRYIWKGINMFHFGDWVAPDSEKMSEWQGRHKWTATASLANTSKMLADIAGILGKKEDQEKYLDIYHKVSDAYESKFTDGKGFIKGKQFQTAYVLPLAFNMFKEETAPLAVNNLAKLMEDNHYGVGTGFPGTPFILFALADNNREDVAFKVLFNEHCPSWLYEVKVGATTTWERWDALKEDGTLNFAEEDGTGGMISFNHYALGAVGDFMYRRILGIEPLTGGYQKFRVKPLISCGLESANGQTRCAYGDIKVAWKNIDQKFEITVEVPFGTECELVLPNGQKEILRSGKHYVTQ